MTTESVKLDRAIVRRLRRYSKQTGIPISRLANRILKSALELFDSTKPKRIEEILTIWKEGE